MLLEILITISIITNITVLSVVGIYTFNYFKLKNKLYKMNAEEILQECLPKKSEEEVNSENVSLKRDRLSALIAGGESKQYIGKNLQLTDVDTMTPEEINKLYSRYEARLGASMTKTLGNSFINLYVMGVSRFFNIPNPPKLIEDLKEDPFINHALTSTCCELYYRYGMYLAPFTAMLTTASHIDHTNMSKENPINEIEIEEITMSEENHMSERN